MSIDWEFKEIPTRKVFGSNPEGFSSRKLAKNHINDSVLNLTCSNCGNRRLSGQGVVIGITKTEIYDQVEKKGIFGKSIKDVYRKTVFVIDSPELKAGGFFGGAGYIECKNCRHKVKAFNGFWGQWGRNLAEAYRKGEL